MAPNPKKTRVPQAPRTRQAAKSGFAFTKQTGLAIAIVVLAAVLLAVLAFRPSSKPASTTAPATPVRVGADGVHYTGQPLNLAGLPGVRTDAARWDTGVAGLSERLHQLRLPALSAEGSVLHIHQHLDVYIYGHRVGIPAFVGINEPQQYISPVHTHTPDGIIHVESPTLQSFTLGEFFGIWGVRLSKSCLGGYCAGSGYELRVWVNGRPASGDPTEIALLNHEEIVVAYGTPAQMPKPAASWAFTQHGL